MCSSVCSDDDGGNPLVTDYQDFDSGDETQVGVRGDANADAEEVTSEPDSDTDDEEKAKQTDSDDSDHGNPLVTVPVDADISDDEGVMAIAAISELRTTATATATTTTIDSFNTNKTTAENKRLKQEAVQQNHVSSDDEDNINTKYEVTGDFDIDEPSIDDWLGGGKGEKNPKSKDRGRRETDCDVTDGVSIYEFLVTI